MLLLTYQTCFVEVYNLLLGGVGQWGKVRLEMPLHRLIFT